MQRSPAVGSPRNSAQTNVAKSWLGAIVLLVGLTTLWNAYKTFSMPGSEDSSSGITDKALSFLGSTAQESSSDLQNLADLPDPATNPPIAAGALRPQETPSQSPSLVKTHQPSVMPTFRRLPSLSPTQLQASEVIVELSKNGEDGKEDGEEVCHVGTKRVTGLKTAEFSKLRGGLKIGVVQITWGKVQGYYERVAALHKKYCEKHNYEYLWVHDHEKVNPKYDHENKQFVLAEFIQKFDYVLYMDIDCMIWNSTVRLESFIEEYPKADIILPGHVHGFSVVGQRVKPICDGKSCGINSGIFLLRRSCWSLKLFNLWCALNTIPFPSGGDQVRLHFIVENNLLDIRQHAGFVPAYRMNTDDSLVVERRARKPRGDFTAHLWGGLKGHFAKTLSEIEQGQVPSMFINREMEMQKKMQLLKQK